MAKGVKDITEKGRRRGIAIFVSGLDGSGKTTLALELCRRFREAGIDAEHCHIHAWYKHIVITPMLLLSNRVFGRKVLVFDRTIYDNLAVRYVANPRLRRVLKAAVRITTVVQPKPNIAICLFASFSQTLQRRPESSERAFKSFDYIYRYIVQWCGFIALESNAETSDVAFRIATSEA